MVHWNYEILLIGLICFVGFLVLLALRRLLVSFGKNGNNSTLTAVQFGMLRKIKDTNEKEYFRQGFEALNAEVRYGRVLDFKDRNVEHEGYSRDFTSVSGFYKGGKE